MSTTSHLPEFMEYLGKRQDMKPDKTFEARGAAEAFEPPSGLFWINAFTQPFFSPGKVFLYPEFLAFLTTTKQSGGAAAYREEVAHNLIDYGKNAYMLHRWMVHPTSAILDIAKILTKAKDTHIVTAALSNPLSFFIPLSKIKEVKTGGGYVQGFKEKRSFVDFQPPYIRITTDETSYVMYAPTEVSFWNFTNVKRSYHMISSKWQTDVVQLLEARVMANNL
jgi:hypothetical protein